MVLNSSVRHTAVRGAALSRRGFLILGVLLALVILGACHMFETLSPQQVVAEFCKQDLLGARLDERSWSDVEDFVNWPISESFTRTFVVSGYRVGVARTTGTTAVVPVVYYVRGVLEDEQWQSWAQGEGRHLVRSVPKEVNFQLESVEGDWVIMEPEVAPHVSLSLLAERVPLEIVTGRYVD